MRNKIKEVPKFQIEYRVFDKTKREVCAIFDDLCDAAAYCEINNPVKKWDVPSISYTLKSEKDYSFCDFSGRYMGQGLPREYNVVSYPAPNYVILTNLGDIVTKQEIVSARKAKYKYRRRKWDMDEWIKARYVRNARLVYKKGSGNKIKKTYRKIDIGCKDSDHNFINVINSYWRPVKTNSETRRACAHANEYGRQIVRAKRRHKNLPSLFDDYASDVWHTEKSWKHNSKRRKRWIPK